MSKFMDRVNLNPFESDNARNSTPEDLPSQFVLTNPFTRLISPKNHILLGARGSGKTAIVKMLSHEYLSKLDHPKAKEIIKHRTFIGTYVPMRLAWVGGVKNKPWQEEGEAEKHFEWRLNISCCSSYLSTLKSCLNTYISETKDKILTERKICSEISNSWFSTEITYTIDGLTQLLADTEYKKLVQEQYDRANKTNSKDRVGLEFDIGLFSPLKRAIEITKRYLAFPGNAVWALCLDEAEYLNEIHQRILNSHMRTFSDGMVFKLTTMPYKHYTLDTNTSTPLIPKDDFSYIYLDTLDVTKKSSSEHEALKDFAENLFERRLAGSKWEQSGATLDTLLGKSLLISNDEPIDQNEIFRLIENYANDNTIRRAKYLLGTKKFDNEIGRKLKGALILRDTLTNQKGHKNTDLYSGVDMVVRCSDGNPRRLLSLLNSFYNTSEQRVGFRPIKRPIQDKILREYSLNEYKRIASEPNGGESIYRILASIGQFFKDTLHYKELGTDLTLSVSYDVDSDQVWSLISEAVGLGLMRPAIDSKSPDDLPVRAGKFRLSYILTPHFELLPRRGKAVSLKTVLKKAKTSGSWADKLENQMDLF